jgi:hypothetical protein
MKERSSKYSNVEIKEEIYMRPPVPGRGKWLKGCCMRWGRRRKLKKRAREALQSF